MTETKINEAEYHTVRVEFDGWGAPSSRFKCTAPAESGCHLEWGCYCDEIYGVETDADGNRYHEATLEAWDDSANEDEGGWVETTERHYASVNPNYCNYAEWYDAVGTEVLTGEITVAVRPEWEGDGYLFEVVGEAA